MEAGSGDGDGVLALSAVTWAPRDRGRYVPFRQ